MRSTCGGGVWGAEGRSGKVSSGQCRLAKFAVRGKDGPGKKISKGGRGRRKDLSKATEAWKISAQTGTASDSCTAAKGK